MLRLPESPYLLRKGRRERALAALGTLRGGPCEAELTALEQATAKETKGAARREAGWRTLLEPKILRRLGVCVVLQFFQQFAGINAIVYFTPHILKSSGTVATLGSSLRLSADSAALLATAVTYFPKIPAMFLTMALMDTWGRAKMLRVFSPAMGLCLGALGLSLGSSSGVAATVALVAIALYGIFFNLSLGPVPNIHGPSRSRSGSAATTVSLWALLLAHAMVSFCSWCQRRLAARPAVPLARSPASVGLRAPSLRHQLGRRRVRRRCHCVGAFIMVIALVVTQTTCTTLVATPAGRPSRTDSLSRSATRAPARRRASRTTRPSLSWPWTPRCRSTTSSTRPSGRGGRATRGTRPRRLCTNQSVVSRRVDGVRRAAMG